MSDRSLARRPANGGVVIPSDPITLGNVLAASHFFDDAKEAAQAAVKVMAGQEIGFGPIASMTGIYIVKGRVTIGANLMAAAVKRQRPGYDYRIVTHSETECEITFLQDGEPLGSSKFTLADAQAAGLANGDNWKKHPRNMLFARALSNGVKWYCPDIFGGGAVYTPEELGAEVDAATGQVVDPEPVKAETKAPTLPEEEVAEIVSMAEALVTGEEWTPSKLKMELVGAGVTDTSTVENAVRTLAPEQADELKHKMADLIAAATGS